MHSWGWDKRIFMTLETVFQDSLDCITIQPFLKVIEINKKIKIISRKNCGANL